MDAGKLDQRIEVKTLVSSSMDMHGGIRRFYSSSSLWANAKTEGGDETIAGGVDVVTSRYVFTVRHTDQIKETSDIYFNGSKYDIYYIESPYGKERWLKIHASRKIGGV